MDIMVQMLEPDDHQLLAEFALAESESAFASLVKRYVNLVYSTAFRFTGNTHHSEEITQAVFIVLARKAEKLSPRVVLSGWLYQTARLTAANFMKGEIRRQQREQEAYMQSALDESNDSAWKEIAPLLDEAMGKLGETDRDAVVLRFFENKSAAEIGSTLRMTEETARRRVNRALEKLRKLFARRGVVSTAAIIAGVVSANSVHAAPAGLAQSISAVAVAKGATASISTITIVKGALKLMAWTKTKSIIVAGVAAILVVGTTAVTVKTVKHFTSLPVEHYFTALSTPVLDSAPPLLVLRPSRYAATGDFAIGGSSYGPDGRIMLRGATFEEVLSTAYLTSPQQMVLPPNLPPGRFDLILTLPQNPRQALQAEIKKQFGLAGRQETQDTDVLVLKTSQTAAPGLKISRRPGPQIDMENGRLRLRGYRISDSSQYDLVHLLASAFNRPVVDETGLTNAYDIDLSWNPNVSKDALLQEIQTLMRERLGLELVPARRSIPMLVIEKAN
jgi:uncharacterized protein (TIGR03435 family)